MISIAAVHLYVSILGLLIPMYFAQSTLLQGCSIIGIPPLSNEAQDELQKIPHLDFFMGPSMQTNSEVVACDEEKDKLLQVLTAHNIQPKILLDDASKMELGKKQFGNIALGTMDWNDYYDLEHIYAWLDKLVAENDPRYVQMEVIGKTHEQREIKAYTVTDGNGGDIDSNLPPDDRTGKHWVHENQVSVAREWTTAAVCTYLIKDLLENKEAHTKSLGLGWTFYIVPVVNPDGYAYTNEAGKHLWRKNRIPIPGKEQATCKENHGEESKGVDLGRNYPDQWRESSDPCLHTYSGVKDQPEAEVNATEEYLLKELNYNEPRYEGNTFQAFIDIRCCSEAIMYPWGYTKDLQPGDPDGVLPSNIAKSNGRNATAGQISHLKGLSYGIAADWAYKIYNNNPNPSYIVETRPTGSLANSTTYMFPFRLPPNKILPAVKEATSIVLDICHATAYAPDFRPNVGDQPKTSTVLLCALSATGIVLHQCGLIR